MTKLFTLQEKKKYQPSSQMSLFMVIPLPTKLNNPFLVQFIALLTYNIASIFFMNTHMKRNGWQVVIAVGQSNILHIHKYLFSTLQTCEHKHSTACQCIQTTYCILFQKHWIHGLQIHSQNKTKKEKKNMLNQYSLRGLKKF